MPVSRCAYSWDYLTDKFTHKFWKSHASKVCEDEEEIIGKITIVTGSSRGIGKEVATELAKRGAVVVMAVRDIDTCIPVAEEIKKHHPKSHLAIMKLDLADFESIREFVQAFEMTYPHLNILVNNAGVMAVGPTPMLTKDGFEQNIAVNHLGTFYLTRLLLGALQRSPTPHTRVVTLASSNLSIAHLDLDDLMMKERPKMDDGGRGQYNISKYCIAVCMRKLVAELEPNTIKFYLMCPGYVKTDLFRYDEGCCRKCSTGCGLCCGGINAHQGAETVCYLCLSKAAIFGDDTGHADFYRFKTIGKLGMKVLKKADGTEEVDKLYKMTHELLGIEPSKSIKMTTYKPSKQATEEQHDVEKPQEQHE